MQRVSALLPSWDRSRQASATPRSPGALEKVFGWAEKIVVPVNRGASTATAPAPTRYGRETYWPTTLDKECDKAARILKSFCFDGFLSQESDSDEAGATEPASTPNYITKKIPPRIIQNAVGLAVFSCMRSGLWMSGSGGAGLITARKADGTWSPPSGIILHTAELGFVIGVDIYDCVLVINSVQTLELFTRPRLTLGVDVDLAVGPLVAVGAKDPEIKWKEISETVLTYVKARGKHQAVQLDGSLVTERGNENERFYCSNVTVLDVLAGNIPKSIPEMRPLFEVIKAAEGRSDFDKTLMEWLAEQPAPGDAVIETPALTPASPTKSAFGMPDANDPDPFGVIGLEMAGIEIREAGTNLRPTSTQFEYHPSPTSPAYARLSRQSMDTFASRSNRCSSTSARTQATATTDAYTQTDVASTADTSFSRANSDDGRDCVEKLPTVPEPEEVDYTQVDMSILERLKRGNVEIPAAEPAQAVEVKEIKEIKVAKEMAEADEKPEATDKAAGTSTYNSDAKPKTTDERDEDADDEDEDEDDEPIICEVATAAAQPTRTSVRSSNASQFTQIVQAKGAIVTIPKRVPPPLPAKSPARASRGSRSEYGDVSSLKSPIRNSFLSIGSQADDFQTLSNITARASEQEQEMLAKEEESSLAERPASPRHQRNSSVCTAVAVHATSVTRDESREGLEEQLHPPVPPTPQTLEASSSAEDESEREPKTPLTEKEFVDAVEHHEPHRQHESKNVQQGNIRIVSPTGSAEERVVMA
ncbi:hypothetical protein MMYC01_203569 [Madurella mycetomatis]|uniref:Ysc84 actin-binding domain-containing protein n=1 Tax=Madurella mycetomatis TaxID=100816 RepID=A0A175W2M8_9PEZI|nr:hypothetical protein MMYC01_204659 [Madurella mycetomatis]KXX80222.1 hypothetical protein MMYC01_203569 [Madurella mycetomatis]